MSSELLKRAAALLRPVPDFPIPDILYWDIAPVLRDHEVVAHLIDLMYERWKDEGINVVAGFDARGFIFGPLLAQRLGAAFEQIRKPGKLPGETISETYGLEYGTDEIEMIDDGFIAEKRVLLMDDLLATGGTAGAGAKLIKRLGGVVAGFTCVTELPELGGRAQLMDYPIYSLVSIIDGKAHVGVDYCVDLLTFSADESELLLVRRLDEPIGLAMPGGHIELEGLLAAGLRELEEETGCTVVPGSILFHSVLTELGRDPRGTKVSYVLLVIADTKNARGETGKTEIARFPREVGLPDRSLLVLGHGDAVHKIPDVLKSFGLAG